MHYVYILRSIQDDRLYVGYTSDLRKRIHTHNNGGVRATKIRAPLTLLYYEAYLAKDDAIARERFLKTGWGRRYIAKNLSQTLKH